MSFNITTYTGLKIDLLNIKEKDINIEDIAHSISMIVRFNGHIKFFYSVGQHCIFVSEALKDNGMDIKMQLCGLLHDASEAYFQDIITPLKHSGLVDVYRQKEEEVFNTILQRFGIDIPTENEKKNIKSADKWMFLNENRVLRNIISDDPGYGFIFKPDIKEESYFSVEEKYVSFFNKLLRLYEQNR
ncbi:hypothetical protein M1145_00130 [Patescibacteria group bacterium]|nr:hypothetical protein [Patescibacteria group bacterium]